MASVPHNQAPKLTESDRGADCTTTFLNTRKIPYHAH